MRRAIIGFLILFFVDVTPSAAVPSVFVQSKSALWILLADNTGKVSADEAAKIAAKVSGGKVISSETGEIRGEKVYLIKVLMSDGKIRIIRIKAASGEIM